MIEIFVYSLMCYGIASAIVYYSGPFDIFAKLRESVSGNKKLEEFKHFKIIYEINPF